LIGKDKDETGKIPNTTIEVHTQHIHHPIYLNYIFSNDNKKDELIIAPFTMFEVVNIFDFSSKKKIVLRMLPDNLLFNLINYPFRIMKRLKLNQNDIKNSIQHLIIKYSDLLSTTKYAIYSEKTSLYSDSPSSLSIIKEYKEYRIDIAFIYHHLAEMNQFLNNNDDSLNNYNEANKIFDSEMDSKVSIYSLLIKLQIAKINAKKLNYEEALTSLGEIFEKRNNFKELGNYVGFLICDEAGKICKTLKNKEKGMFFLLNALGQTLSLFGENNITTINSYIALSKILCMSNENDPENVDLLSLDKAEQNLAKALKIAENIYGKKHLNLKVSYINECLGQIYYKLKKYDKAKDYYNLTLNYMLSFISEETEVAARLYKELANINFKLKDHKDFKTTIKKCLDIYEKINNLIGYNQCLILQGDYYFNQNLYEEAIYCYDKVINECVNSIRCNYDDVLKDNEVIDFPEFLEYPNFKSKSLKQIYEKIESNEELKIQSEVFYNKLKNIFKKDGEREGNIFEKIIEKVIEAK